MSIFNLGKKKEEVVELQKPTVFEDGKEVQFKDPKTGEFVFQRPVSPELRAKMFQSMNGNAGLAQQFINTTRQTVEFLIAVMDINTKIKSSEKDINDKIKEIRDDMKLDGRWTFNMQLGCMERREPPEG